MKEGKKNKEELIWNGLKEVKVWKDKFFYVNVLKYVEGVRIKEHSSSYAILVRSIFFTKMSRKKFLDFFSSNFMGNFLSNMIK